MLASFKKLLGLSSGNSRKVESRGAHPISLLVLLIVGSLGYQGVSFIGVLILVMLGVTVYEFVKRIDQGLPLMQAAALLSVLQWNAGPWLTYNIDLFYSTYGMRVASNTYFMYAIPGTAAFVMGLLSVGLSPRQRGLFRHVDRTKFVQIGMILVMLGLAAGLAAGFVPGGLAFVFFLVSQLRYVGALYFICSRSPLRWFFAGLSVLPLFTGTAESGMFHDLLLWMGILMCYVYALKPRKIWLAVVVGIAGLVLVFTIQGIKKSYRDKVWNSEQGSLVGEFKNFWESPRALYGEETLSNAIIRINQGWIVASIMANVPSSEPYAMGDTVVDAVTAALLPRLFAQNKATAGGRVNFRRFTGLPIADSTSMGLSLLGESYANVGPEAGVFLMLLFGLLMSLCYGSCLLWAVKHPTFYFWIPVIFCQTIKAETDLVTVLNHIIKGSIVVFGLYWLICIQLLPAASVRKGPKRRASELSVACLGKRGFTKGAR